MAGVFITGFLIGFVLGVLFTQLFQDKKRWK